jgi:hypothetical protein
LQEFPAKNVFERFTYQLRFGCEQRASEGGLPPLGKRGVTIEKGWIANWHDVVLAIV